MTSGHFNAIFAVLAGAALLLPQDLFAATSVGGRVSTDTTWTVAGSPFIVTSSVQVFGTTSTPITLTIEPGVIVKFQTGTSLSIGSSAFPANLAAIGTLASPIIFTSAKDDTAGGDTNGDGGLTTPESGDWRHIFLTEGSSSSVLDGVEVRYGGSDGQGNIYIFNSSPTIQNSVIEQSSSVGIFIQTNAVTSSPQILNNQIQQNTTHGIQTRATFGPLPVAGLIQGNTIISSGEYGLYFEGRISASIRDNEIARSLFFTDRDGSPTLIGNLITDLGSVVTQIPADLIEMFQTQNTLEGITPTTSLFVISDTISNTTTLTTLWNRYVVKFGLIEVRGTAASPATLIVEAGVVVSFDANSGIRVGAITTNPGALRVLGTEAAPVLFTRSTTAGWSGIHLESGTLGAQTTIQHAIIEYGGIGTDPGSVNLRIQSTSPTLDNVIVRFSSQSGIGLHSASPVMNNITVEQVGGDGIRISSSSGGSSAPIISQALITSTGRHGIYMDEPSGLGATMPRIENSIIQNPIGYGVYIDRAVPSILNNIIEGSLFVAGSTGQPIIIGNTISNFNTKRARIPIDILRQVETQNTLLDIDSTTVLELTGDVVTASTTLGLRWKIYHVVAGHITVGGTPAAVLTIKPGVTMRFGQTIYLGVGTGAGKGILVAKGTATEPILLTTLNSPPNNWRGIILSNNNVAGASLLEHVIVDIGGQLNAAISANSTAFTMKHCTIRNSSTHGIQLVSADLTMQFCQVHDNSQSGLFVQNQGGFSDESLVQMANSDFFNNGQDAITNEQFTVVVDARNNWWGDSSGPSGSGAGIGEAISTQVLFDPWLGTPFTHPFALVNGFPSSTAFTPAGGETRLTAELTQSGNWSVQITDAAGAVIKSTSGLGRLIDVAWDGTDTTETVQPNGSYNFRMEATATSTAAPIIGRLQLNDGLPIAKISTPLADELILTPSVDIAGTADSASFSDYSVEVGLGTSPFQFINLSNAAAGPIVDGRLATWTIQTNPPSSLYQIRLKVTDAGGTAEATRLVRIDRTPPLPPDITPPPSPSSTQPITVTGTTEVDATVELYVNEALVDTVAASETGSFAFANVALTLGTNTLKARATDRANNIGSFSPQTSVLYLPPGESLIEILSPADGSSIIK